MTDRKFEFGDRVRHTRRPEWGTGSVIKAENVSHNGEAAQRLAVRFPNAGLKTLSTTQAELELVTDESAPTEEFGHASTVADWHKLQETEWAPIARRKVEQAMVELASDVRDPFQPLKQRLAMTLDLFRFGRSGRTLMDWAVAQTGLKDPLSHFTRHELEVLFDQWAVARDDHLHKLLSDARPDSKTLQEALAGAPQGASEAVRRITVQR